MATIMLTVSQLIEKKEELSSLNKETVKTIEEFTSVGKSFSADWEGDAANAFQEQIKQIAERLSAGINGVESYIKALDTIIQQYRAAEQKNVSIARNMK